MKATVVIILLSLTSWGCCWGQSRFVPQPNYLRAKALAIALTMEARDSIDYARVAATYDSVFALVGDRAVPKDRYDAGRAWAEAGQKERAWADWLKAVRKDGFIDDFGTATREAKMLEMDKDSRWNEFWAGVLANQAKKDSVGNPGLMDSLETVFHRDQDQRLLIDSVQKQFGFSSEQLKNLWKSIASNDSANLVFVNSVVARYGWPGPDIVGRKGDLALFMVIQHADSATQVRYLPILKEVARTGGVEYSELSMLEDRILMKQGQKQIYGSQLRTDPQTGKQTFYPIADEANVDERRASMGLMPLHYYAKLFGIDYTLPAKQ